MRPATSRIFQTPFAIDPNDFIPTAEVITLGSWSGSADHYYQSLSLSKQFDLATTLIVIDTLGGETSGAGYEYEIVDGTPTTVKIYSRVNTTAGDIRVEITEGLTYVDYFTITKSHTIGSLQTYTETVASIADWADGKTKHKYLATGGFMAFAPSVGADYCSRVGNMSMTAATTFEYDIWQVAAGSIVMFFVNYRY